MNTEDFVNFKQAFKLKDLGFNEKCLYHYSHMKLYPNNIFESEGPCLVSINSLEKSYNTDSTGEDIYDAPTLAQVQKWLIKEKFYYIQPDSDCSNIWLCDIVNLRNGDLIQMYKIPDQPNYYESYEKALSAGITECIKLLENEL